MSIKVHLRNVNEKRSQLSKSAAAKGSASPSKAFEEEITKKPVRAKILGSSLRMALDT